MFVNLNGSKSTILNGVQGTHKILFRWCRCQCSVPFSGQCKNGADIRPNLHHFRQMTVRLLEMVQIYGQTCTILALHVSIGSTDALSPPQLCVVCNSDLRAIRYYQVACSTLFDKRSNANGTDDRQ